MRTARSLGEFGREGGVVVELAVGGVDFSVSDVSKDDMGVWTLGLDILWLSGVSGAGSSGNTWLGRISVSWVVRVEPEHVDCMVIPDGEDEGHSLGKGS